MCKLFIKLTISESQAQTSPRFSLRGEITIILVWNDSLHAYSVSTALLNISLRARLELIIDWFVLLNHKKPLTSDVHHKYNIGTHVANARASFIAELIMEPNSKQCSELPGRHKVGVQMDAWRSRKCTATRLAPVRITFGDPKRRNDTAANIRLSHWRAWYWRLSRIRLTFYHSSEEYFLVQVLLYSLLELRVVINLAARSEYQV